MSLSFQLRADLDTIKQNAEDIILGGNAQSMSAAKRIKQTLLHIETVVRRDLAEAERQGRATQEHYIENQEGV